MAKEKVNTHGLKMIGLEKASKATVDWPIHSGGYTEIIYNISSGEVWTSDHVGENFSVYDDPEIIKICNTVNHMSEQRIADAIEAELDFITYVRNNC